jgi:hypothetical protein
MSAHRGLRSVAAITLALLGCAKEAEFPPLVQVKGRVVEDERPVPGGFLIFKSQDPEVDLIINGPVDDKGRFELTTVKKSVRASGVPEGRYQVVYIPPREGKNVTTITLQDLETIDVRTTEVVIEIGKRQE